MNRHLWNRSIVMEPVQVNKGDILTARVLHHGFDVSVANPGKCHIKRRPVAINRCGNSIVQNSQQCGGKGSEMHDCGTIARGGYSRTKKCGLIDSKPAGNWPHFIAQTPAILTMMPVNPVHCCPPSSRHDQSETVAKERRWYLVSGVDIPAHQLPEDKWTCRAPNA